ncbi:hypothetical protein GCM10028857_04690 [Salinarchaeum chitinilyticum]
MAIGLEGIGAVLSVGVAMTVAGAWPLYKGWRRRDRYRLVRDAPTETPATTTINETVLLTGTATKRDGTVTAPLSGDDALLATWSILEWQDETKMKYWSDEARGLRRAPIQIEAEGEAVALPERSNEAPTDALTSIVGFDAITGFEIGGALVELENFDISEDVPQADDPPERFRKLERQIGLDAPDPGVTLVDLGRTHGTRRYREAALNDGDAITIRGTLRTAEEPGAAPVLSAPDDGPLLVSDLDADALERRYRRSYRILFYGTIAVILTMMLFAALVVTA